MGLKVLIVDFDVFRAIGGGQTVYQKLIRQRPEDDFFYFTTSDEPAPELPPNCRAIPFHQLYSGLSADALPGQGHFLHVFRETMNLAGSVHRALGSTAFDVVDTPDYRQNGLFLRSALAVHGIKVGEVALALHGTLSSALRSAWSWEGEQQRFFAELHLRERLQFNVVDSRYAISEAYAGELSRRSPLPINLVDPMLFVGAPRPVAAEGDGRAPDLAFVGRREKRKGPDLFLDLAWWAPRDSYGRLLIIGPDGINHQGGGSDQHLERVAGNRGLEVAILGGRGASEIDALFRSRTVSLLPSRYDQFNLVALESLIAGCPTLVSDKAGVAGFIRHRLAPIADMIIGVDCGRGGAAVLTEVLGDYDRARARVIAAIEGADLSADADSLAGIYGGAAAGDRRMQALVADMADRFLLFSSHHLQRPTPRVRDPLLLTAGAAAVGIGSAARLGRAGVRRGLGLGRAARRLIARARPTLNTAAQQLLITRHSLAAKAIPELHLVGSLAGVRQRLSSDPERTDKDIARKISYLNQLVSERKVDRARWFTELSRLERKRGQDLIAAAYDLRLLRWLPDDRLRVLDRTVGALENAGYAREAQAAEVMYRDPKRRNALTRDYLEDQRGRHRTNPERPFALIDDRRGSAEPKVSVIISMYKAAGKLPTFLAMLEQQTLLKQGRVEVILVDSGSPDREREVFEDFVSRGRLAYPVVYARSRERETIQSAWNRGIGLSRGEYLAFYGVDEGMRPDCLERLASELDGCPKIDWAMADSIVTSVDRRGVFDQDIMVYDRTGYRQDWPYLDSTFLSYVGGLYRRSIHDRVGYYDASFGAAGDTEFKNRALPFISTVHVPERLGVFNNYPEARATHHPRAELEDLRAWYLHRTSAGMGYAFDHREPSEGLALLRDTLAYRKCYRRESSTDFDLAAALAEYLATRNEGAGAHELQSAFGELPSRMAGFELWSSPRAGLAASFELARDIAGVADQARRAAGTIGVVLDQDIEVFNDNRYDQHWWSWSAGAS